MTLDAAVATDAARFAEAAGRLAIFWDTSAEEIAAEAATLTGPAAELAGSAAQIFRACAEQLRFVTGGGMPSSGLLLRCQAAPEDCPNGPGPHRFIPPADPAVDCCCRQPWEDRYPVTLADVFLNRVIITLIRRAGGVPQTFTKAELGLGARLISHRSEGAITMWVAPLGEVTGGGERK